MDYSTRLKAARAHAKLTQAELAKKAGVTQPTVSYLENIENACTGSEYTVQFARACDINAGWLADESGQMISTPVTAMTTGEPAPQHLRELLDLCYALDGEALREVIGMARYLRNRAAEQAAAKPEKSSG